jgi:hypothetical protein
MKLGCTEIFHWLQTQYNPHPLSQLGIGNENAKTLTAFTLYVHLNATRMFKDMQKSKSIKLWREIFAKILQDLIGWGCLFAQCLYALETIGDGQNIADADHAHSMFPKPVRANPSNPLVWTALWDPSNPSNMPPTIKHLRAAHLYANPWPFMGWGIYWTTWIL